MLTALSIRDLVLIDRLDQEFGTGLCVLTGETGAGKSIVLDALGLALGGRGDAGLVRMGSDKAVVTAVFALPPDHVAHTILDEYGIEKADEMVIRRIQSADGKSKVLINDQPAGVGLLRQIGDTVAEIHGQHDVRALMDPAQHCRLVDDFGQTGELQRATAGAWSAWQQAQAALEEHERLIQDAVAEREYLEHSIAELERLKPQEGEEQLLADKRQKLMQAEHFSEALGDAATALENGDALDHGLNAALRKLERHSQQMPDALRDVCSAIERVLTELHETQLSVDSALADMSVDPQELEMAEERLFALRAIARKHNLQVDQLRDLLTRMQEQLGAIVDGAQITAELEKAVGTAKTGYLTRAQDLSEKRRQAAERLDAAVMAELGPLRLERALFRTRIESDPEKPGPTGHDSVFFEVATNPGSRPGPLAKVASGGELSRFMLALKVVLAASGSAPTLVFDEIDTGVGGSVADAIGQRLARLAKELQVFAVTHSPQVAARADAHLLISKIAEVGAGEDKVVTRVAALEGPSRAEEIARMLSGADVTDEARAQAERLLRVG